MPHASHRKHFPGLRFNYSICVLLLALAACEAQTAAGSSSKPSDQLPPLIPLKLLLGNSKYRNAQVCYATQRAEHA
jgi:hypothetical protein